MAKNAASDHQALQARTSGYVDAPATVGEYISGVVLKELWAVQLQRQPCPFDHKSAQDLVARVSPALAHDILDAVRGWIPIADELCPSTLLPDLDEFPPSVSDEDGISLAQRKLLLEALKIVFDVFNEDCAASLKAGDAPILPRPSVAAVSVQIAAMLEHLSLTRPRGGEAQLQQGELDFRAWQNVCAHAGGKPQPGSKRELIEELQHCRRQIFDLEKELVTQVKIADASANREKREADKAAQRLSSINQHLEEKLRSRTEESKQSKQRIEDLERRITHEQDQGHAKGKKILMLENELARTARMQDDLLLRERKYGERILELRMEEFMSICRDNQRQKKLECAIKGECAFDEGNEELDEKDLCELAESTLKKVQHEFDGFFEERQKCMVNVAQKCEAQLAKEREWLEDDGEKHVGRMSLIKFGRKSSLRPPTHSIAVQTDMGKDHEGRSPSIKRERASVCGADFLVRKRQSVLQKAELDLMRAKRQSATLGQPLRASLAAESGMSVSPSADATERLEQRLDSAASPSSDDDEDAHSGHSEAKVSREASIVAEQVGAASRQSERRPSAASEQGRPASRQSDRGSDQGRTASRQSDRGSDQARPASRLSDHSSPDITGSAGEQDDEVEESLPRQRSPKFAKDKRVDDAEDTLSPQPPAAPPPGNKFRVKSLPVSRQSAVRSVTPSTRASSRNESRNGRISALSGSRSGTPWQADALELPVELRASQPQPSGRGRDTWHAGKASGRRSILTFDRGVN